ncbi:uncharacterized protein LOC111709012 [Eurytemora carolleeae]|uniref:uncharacterized protein LOC111709012 n=1 Tax=Eurytemora carolleeae TaxID=1294199 RepID=UPI000C760EC0|nr:uncharacterized protein LOC111709012 [Eurytemora carolleeae]|eukprot:XP_023338346.1 uncharacterized protein LOC111709012 [Eurytemora affinis]
MMKAWISNRVQPLPQPGQFKEFKRRNWKVKCPKIEEVYEFCSETSLHGLKYVTEDGVIWAQRVLWVILFILALVFLVFLTTPLFNKYIDAPTFTSIDTTNYPISNIKFPGVTVCSNIRVSRNQFYEEWKRMPWRVLHHGHVDLGKIVMQHIKFISDPAVMEETFIQTVSWKQMLELFFPTLMYKEETPTPEFPYVDPYSYCYAEGNAYSGKYWKCRYKVKSSYTSYRYSGPLKG